MQKRSLVRFVLWSETVQTPQLIAAIGVTPTELADQEITNSDGYTRPQSWVSYWSSLSEPASLAAQFDDLVDRLAPAMSGLQSLMGGGLASAELIASFDTERPAVGFVFSPRQLAFLTTLGLGLRLVVTNIPEAERQRAAFQRRVQSGQLAEDDPSQRTDIADDQKQ